MYTGELRDLNPYVVIAIVQVGKCPRIQLFSPSGFCLWLRVLSEWSFLLVSGIKGEREQIGAARTDSKERWMDGLGGNAGVERLTSSRRRCGGQRAVRDQGGGKTGRTDA